jgi:hypothetical protein
MMRLCEWGAFVMNESIDLQKLERHAFRASFQDGMTDVMLGSVLAVMSMMPWLESLGIPRLVGYLIYFAVFGAIWAEMKVIKTQIVAPRLGTAVFSPARKNKIKQARRALIVMVAMTMLLVVLTVSGVLDSLFGEFSEWSGYLFIGAIFVVSLSLLAFFLDYPRLYAYGWFLAVMDPFSVWLAAQTGWVFPTGATIFGMVIIVIGVLTFNRFLRQHPVPSVEMINDHPDSE